MRRYVGLAALFVAVLTVIVWLVSQFIQPILPGSVNSSAILLFAVLLGVAALLGNFKDVTELVRWILRNGDNASDLEEGEAISEQSLLLYPYDNPPYNSVEAHFVGKERAKDLKIWKLFMDADGVERRLEPHLFPLNDTRMIWHHISVNVLKEGDGFRFHLVGKDNTLDGKARVEATFTGVQSGREVKLTKEFDLKR